MLDFFKINCVAVVVLACCKPLELKVFMVVPKFFESCNYHQVHYGLQEPIFVNEPYRSLYDKLSITIVAFSKIKFITVNPFQKFSVK